MTYTSTTLYVDIETGEKIRNYQAQKSKQYLVIKTTKTITYDKAKTRGTIEYTKQCRRNPQGNLFTTGE